MTRIRVQIAASIPIAAFIVAAGAKPASAQDYRVRLDASAQNVSFRGLISDSIQKIKDKVPVLGDLPWVGRLFRSESLSSTKRNLLIFVTPTIIDPSGNSVHASGEMPFEQTRIPAGGK